MAKDGVPVSVRGRAGGRGGGPAVRYSISRVLKAGQGLAESPGWPSSQETGRRGVWGGEKERRGGASKAKDSARQVASTRDDEAGSSGARSREGGVME